VGGDGLLSFFTCNLSAIVVAPYSHNHQLGI
jgi:hypothetical protein